jgi:2-dehydro-3-deoxy-D-arabinonate dehydratase
MTLIVRYEHLDGAQVGLLIGDTLHELRQTTTIDDLLSLDLDSFRSWATSAEATSQAIEMRPLLPPIDGRTEVWAAGVTYLRSRASREEESADPSVYARVYDAERPEIFFKSVAWRVVGPGHEIGVRADSPNNVPEAELGLVANGRGEILGITAGNDVSSRSIEGENPLYLPQAKVYDGSCALGPGIRPIWEVNDLHGLGIRLEVARGDEIIFSGEASTASLQRTPEELIGFLRRAMGFPHGMVLLTGTSIVPELDFTLEPGDSVRIGIDDVGVLENRVRRVGTDS